MHFAYNIIMFFSQQTNKQTQTNKYTNKNTNK